MDRLERLLNLVAALLAAERPLTREELQERVPGYGGTPESARRAFERDKDALRTMGIPIATERVDDATEGYRIAREDYELPDPGLSADELAALHLAASAVRLGGVEGTEAIWKLGGASAEGERAPQVAIPGGEHLDTLFGAVTERRVVTFRYRGADREVEPQRLAFRDGRWYLSGHDRTRGDGRSFRLDRLESPPVAGAPRSFERAIGGGGPPPPPWEMGDGEATVARLLVDASQAEWATARAGEEAVVERRPDGAVVLALRVTNRDAFRSFVLGLLDHAEVLGPVELRDDLVAHLERLVATR